MSFSGMLITSQWRNSRLTGSALEGTSGSVKYKSADDYIHFNKRLDDAICTPYQSCIRCRDPLMDWPLDFYRFVSHLSWCQFISLENQQTILILNLLNRNDLTFTTYNQLISKILNLTHLDRDFGSDINYVRDYTMQFHLHL